MQLEFPLTSYPSAADVLSDFAWVDSLKSDLKPFILATEVHDGIDGSGYYTFDVNWRLTPNGYLAFDSARSIHWKHSTLLNTKDRGDDLRHYFGINKNQDFSKARVDYDQDIEVCGKIHFFYDLTAAMGKGKAQKEPKFGPNNITGVFDDKSQYLRGNF